MRKPLRFGPCAALLGAVLWVGAGCQSVQDAAETAAGLALPPDQAASAKTVIQAVAKTFESFTPEQEYYIGRSVGALILHQYPPAGRETVDAYLNRVGQTLARFSDRPDTFAGYHFLLLETDEINAFAAPGGLIFVSRGMLRCCRTEDALAAVLAHEIGHVQLKHGLKAIRQSRVTAAFAILAQEGAKTMGSRELQDLTRTFEDTLGDITQSLVKKGYGTAQEKEADKVALRILRRAGYNPAGLLAVLDALQQRGVSDKKGFFKTHPDVADRLADARAALGVPRPLVAVKERQTRFERALADL